MNADRWRARRRCPAMAAMLAAALLVAGCGTRRVTDTRRTGSEQLLVSAAVDRAARQLDFAFLGDRRVFIDAALVDRADRDFVIGAVRFWAWQRGCVVVPVAADAQYVLELRSGAVGVDRSDYILGIPSAEVPTPWGVTPLPEAAVFRSTNQTGICRLSFTVYRRDDRQFLYSSGPVYGYSDQRAWWLLGLGPAITDNVRPARSPVNTGAEPPGPPQETADLSPPRLRTAPRRGRAEPTTTSPKGTPP